MPSLTLKSSPNDLMDQLREVADQDRRSIIQQVLYMLEQSLAARTSVPDQAGDDQ